MRQKIILFIGIALVAALVLSSGIKAEEPVATPSGAANILPLREFIDLAVRNDTEFEKILIDELSLQYEKDLGLPADDLVLKIKGQHDLMLSQERAETGGSMALARLFPYTGTSVETEYTTASSYTSTENATTLTVEVSQPIAQNAFGKATRLKDKIIGVELDVARHQIIEAYEDYLAAVITGYYIWYEAYENLNIGESSYNENLKLLDNIKERQKSNIALAIDVNKVHLQVLAKKEKLIELKEEYANALNFIEQATRYDGKESLVPHEPEVYKDVTVVFEEDFEKFKDAGRTCQVLNLLEQKSKLEVDEEADDLLPSINVLVGYNIKGRDFEIENEDNMAYAGITVAWPFGDQVDRAEYETSKITLEKTKLTNTGTRFGLYTDIKDLSIQINSEKELLNIAKEKIGLAKSILKDETENYSFGKVMLNDYIDAVNVLDNNRFNEVLHDSQHKKLLVEWLRMTDRLVSKSDVYEK